VRCLSCQYDLSNLTPSPEGGHRCPECGRAFDPSNPTSFDGRHWKWRTVGVVFFYAVVAIAILVLLYTTYLGFAYQRLINKP